MKLGAHVSIAGGVANAPLNAHKKKCETFQMFSRSPRGGSLKLTENEIAKFKKNCARFGYGEFFIHAPYYINLASNNNRIRHGSIGILKDELRVANLLGAAGVMFHLGSAKDFGLRESIALAAKGIKEILKNYRGKALLLIENSAGAGQILGDDLKEIRAIFQKVKHPKLGVCFDTCHGFASGYDLRNKKAVDATLKTIAKTVGLENIKVFHLNDSLVDLGTRRDRHAPIGQGKIGKAGFQFFINHPLLKNKCGILETPDVDETPIPSLNMLKNFRD